MFLANRHLLSKLVTNVLTQDILKFSFGFQYLIQSFYSLAFQILFIKKQKQKNKRCSETEQDPVGSSYVRKLFHVLSFLFIG